MQAIGTRIRAAGAGRLARVLAVAVPVVVCVVALALPGAAPMVRVAGLGGLGLIAMGARWWLL